MLSQRLVRAAGAATPRSALRAFSSTSQQLKVPSMADVTPAPQSVASFNEKSKQFREQLAEQQKQREARQKAEASQEPPRKAGPLTNLIYGTKEGRELDAQLEASFSQVLARGKYVHSIVHHEVKPDKVEEYTKLVGSWYPRMASMPENKVNLVGSWRTEVGDCDTFVHIWEYQRYQGYHESIHNIGSHPEFAEFDRKLKSLITSKKTSLMQEFSFWPTTPPRQLGGVFELRSYTLHPGNLLEWETHWRRGLKARREVMEGVGAWFVQIGDLNTVHHLWQFANLEERKIRREKSWSVEGWSETVHKTVPLIQTMKSRILIPMPWSPVA
ncbi:NipSnap family protein [Colletotrichum higginsianum]|uniref:NipSnap family protein n=1 Tax=Colletotrichum higginsianum TaxID=80884 RepID=A0A4T0VVL8_9PEZI|nr:NipSnap family protein [Colletotrichum higginsianum]